MTAPAMRVATPTVSLPKGGGAIRGIDEKFTANPATGSSSFAVGIPTSPGRSNFGPRLELSYDSGNGNGPFGFGWDLALPSVSRKTSQGLPQYQDGIDSDDFVLSGAEDLVPVYRSDPDRTWIATHPGHVLEPGTSWVRDRNGRLVIHEDAMEGYRVRRYRPRVEGSFSRVERWSRIDSPGDVHWRSISRDNVLSIYGFASESRIADSVDTRRIFRWLLCESRDDKGNAMRYRYRAEDGQGVDASQLHERNRGAPNDPCRAANRYLKRILYGNRVSLLVDGGRPVHLPTVDPDWMFEVVLDYGEHGPDAPKPQDDDAVDLSGNRRNPWGTRPDPFSSYRSGFEVRTSRRCRRVLMFHHFPGEPDVGRDCLVRSTDFTYSDDVTPTDARNPVYSFLKAVTQTGYRRAGDGYARSSLPPAEFGYSQPVVGSAVEEVDSLSLENLPIGMDASAYQWVDVHGEGVPGILTEQAGAWFYKRNLSPVANVVRFAAVETLPIKPNVSLGGDVDLVDLAGDGRPDALVLGSPPPGLYVHDEAEGWNPFRPFTSRLNRDFRDPNVRLIDLDGDGHADVLVSEDADFVWHESLANAGFGPARRVAKAPDEESGPRIVFADGTQSIYLADLSGDGLADIVRIRNGDVCYWPNLGYGRFGSKVGMDNAPWFDHPEQFDHKRIRLADIDGSGTTDIIYLHRDGVRLYFNQSGNAWSAPTCLMVFPHVDELVSIAATDLLGNGTACLVWSSPLPGDVRAPLRYVNLMGAKPHLLTSTVNNLGAESRIRYAPSTRFYLQDKCDGHPWLTRLPFPVHVVERVETYDHISHNRFVTRYAYHHGYFDGVEREFRGFGMVEQWDTEEYSTFMDGGRPADNISTESHVPPVHTKMWFHTGAYLAREEDSSHAAVDPREFYREPGLTETEARAVSLPDTVIPDGLSARELREAHRSLKGAMLRQEVYADDASAGATPEHEQRARTPYTVTAQCMAVAVLQPQDTNRHAVFFAYPRESITYQYERNPADPRIQHSLHLEVDEFGNVVKQVAVNYGRREPDGTLPADDDRDQQALVHIAYTENSFTNAIADVAEHYRTPMPAESRTFELRRPRQDRSSGGVTRLFRLDDLASVVAEVADGSHDIPCEDREFELAGTAAAHDPAQAHRFFRRLVEHVRTLYRPDDCGTSQNDPLALLALGDLERLALAGDSYKLALTPGLLDQVFQRPRPGQPDESLIPVPEAVLGGISGSGGYVDLDGDGSWWIPTGRVFYHPNEVDAPIELTQARANFFLPRRSRDPFGHDAVVDFDEPYNLLAVESRDALGNRVTAEANDYRVLQPYLVSDPNRNRTQVAFDILGMVVGMAVMGKALPAPPQGDSLGGFVSDLDQWQIDGLLMHPRRSRTAGRESEATPIVHDLISNATTRFVYDVTRYLRLGEPAVSVAVTRETHVSQLRPGQESKLQISFSYSDGFGREIQRKVQATSGPLVPEGVVASPRWVGSGWTIFNNKGKPVRRFEPFFSATHEFEFEAAIGVSPVLFYDPVGRVIVTLHPNHTYEKVVFDAWQQTTYDVNDTSAPSGVQTGDPRDDSDVGRYTEEYFAAQPPDWRTWGAERSDGSLGPHEAAAAARAGAHADTPVTSYLDALGRPFLIVARNRIQCPGHPLDGAEDTVVSRVERDIHGNICVLRDERRLPVNGLPVGSREERTVMRCSYDMNGSRLTEQSMEAGSRWTLGDVTGKAIRSWDSRGHGFATVYDALRRPLERTVFGATDESDPRTRMASGSLLVEKILYGEGQANAEELNLRTGIYRHFDSGGVVTNAQLDDQGVPLVAYDFKGNLLTSRRQLTTAYDVIPDWSQDPQPRLDPEYFEASTSYDALDRPIQSVAPHSNVIRAQHPNRLSILQPVFNDANLLERLDVWLERPATPGSLLDPSSDRPSMIGVTNIDYDAKSQRLMIEYKNGASTNYQYDPLTFRLTRLASRRDSIAFPGDDQQTVGWLGRQVQNLAYTYDPVGNLTHIHDDAQQSIFFKNRRVEPSSDYVYDSVYRLVEATGREHLGQSGGSVPHRYLDVGRVGIRSANASGGFAPNDGNAMGRYTERYVYDAVGNCLQMQHAVAAAGQPGWTRRFDYGEPSQLEPAKQSNRLSRSIVGSDAAEIYTYDAQGNMRSMPQLQAMLWDYEGRLLMTRRQRVNDEDGDGIEHEGERTYYVYDGSGQRLRKVTILGAGAVKDERIYLGDFEVHRVLGDPNDAGHVALERETLHVRDDKQRIAVIETRTLDEMGVDPGPRRLARYQLGNHLGSATLELDEQAKVISYEEYSPFGSTTYQAVRSQTEVAKRYRYTAKERDEESGLNYHGVRYYAPWVGRWISPDAIRFINRYLYCDANPITLVDRDGNAPTGVIESQPDTGAPTAPAPRIVRRQQQAAEDPDPVKTEEELAELQRTHMEHLQKDAYTSDYEPNPQGGAPRINHHVKGCTCIWHDPPAAEKQPDEEPPVEQKSTSVIETRPPKPPAERPKRTAPWIFDPIDIYGHMKAKEQAPVTPPPLLPVNRLYTATDIHFKGFHLWDVVGDVKAEFADESYVVDIGIVAKMMTRHPELHVRVEAYTGCTPALAWAQPSGRTKEAYDRFGRLMDARAKLVQDELVKRGVSRDRIDLSRGAALTGDANRKVEFYFYIK